MAVAANEARRTMRSRRPSVHEISVGDIELEGVPDFRSDPLADSIASSDLRRVLESLDPTDRALIALRYVAELSSDEIGRALGMSSSGARGRLSRLLLRLRGELRDALTSTSSSGASPRPFVPTPTRALVRSRRSRSPVPRSPAPGRVPRVSAGRRRVAPDGSAGPRHHPSRRRSPAARRRGVGGGLRHPAAADESSRRFLHHRSPCDRHGVAGRDADAERFPVTIADSLEPRPDMDAGPCSMSSRGRVSPGSAIASCLPTWSPARSVPPPTARTGRHYSLATLPRAMSTCSGGPSRAGRTPPSDGGTRRIMTGGDIAGAPPITARDIVQVVRPPAAPTSTTPVQGPDRVDRHRTEGHRRPGPLRPRLGRLGHQEAWSQDE